MILGVILFKQTENNLGKKAKLRLKGPPRYLIASSPVGTCYSVNKTRYK